jgi:hypothetical protein
MSPHRSRAQTRNSARMRHCRSSSSPPPCCITERKCQISFSRTNPLLGFERRTTAIVSRDDWCRGGLSEKTPQVPSEDLGEGLDVAFDHLLLGGALPAGLGHHDESARSRTWRTPAPFPWACGPRPRWAASGRSRPRQATMPSRAGSLDGRPAAAAGSAVA